MTVYVDPSAWPYRGQLYCHVWADTVEELHAAAQAAGLRREWFQCPPKASWEHYDCAPRIRAILVRNGAVETDRYGPVEHVEKMRLQHPDPKVRERARKMLANVALVREAAEQQQLRLNLR